MFHLPSHPIRLRARDLLWPIWLAPGWIALWIAVSLPVDGQTLTQTPVGIQTVDTSREQGLLGMGVFGPVLGIHGADSLLVAGDLVLDHASVVGEGVLVLKSQQPKRLISTNSTLTNLAIDNPAQVTLEGDLQVTQHLTVREGTFATDNGSLMLAPACQTQLLAGGQLKTGPTVQPALPVARLAINYPLTGLLSLTPPLPAPAIRVTRREGPTAQADNQYADLAHEKPLLPPETTVW